VDVRFELDPVRRQFGAEVVGHLTDDLRHLAPDLVRWHLPRQPDTYDGLLEPDAVLPLAEYGDAMLWARVLTGGFGPQTVELHVGPHADTGWRPGRPFDAVGRPRPLIDSWVGPRDLWDARSADGLRRRIGGGDRTPFHTGDGHQLTKASLPTSRPTGDPVALVEWIMLLQEEGQFEQAWADGGIALHDGRRIRVAVGSSHPGETGFVNVPVLATALSTLESGTTLTLPSRSGQSAGLTVTVGRTGVTARVESWSADRPAVPRSWWQRLPDLELLRRRKIDLAGLHPLVRARLFPDYSGDPTGYRPIDAIRLDPIRVRCDGRWHQLGWHDGRIAPLDHPAYADSGTQRGDVPRCIAIVEAWRAGTATAKRLRLLRRDTLLAARHGDVDGIARLLDLGLDPAGVRDDRGRNLLHYLRHEQDGVVWNRLRQAGLDPDPR